MASLAEKPAGDSENFDHARFDQQVHVGARLAGRYRLERRLRKYAGGDEPGPQAWIGFDEVLNREVGVDLIASAHPRAEAVESAARDAATVSDVRFVQVLDVADEDGLIYVVTEWISDATDLAEKLVGGPLGVAPATRIARDLAGAVAEAHACDMRHGALAPDKILLTSTNQVKILGLCLETAMAGDKTDAGTAAVDVHAVGMIWYAALTGRWPGEESAFGLEAAPRTHDRPFAPAQIRAAIPKAVDQLVEQVLESKNAEAPVIDSAKTLTMTIAALPRMREETENTDVLPRTVPRRQPVYPVAAPTAVQQAAVTGTGGAGGTSRARRGLIAVILGVVVVVGAVAAFQLGGKNGNSPGTSSSAPSGSGVGPSASTVEIASHQVTIAKATIWDSDQGTDDAQRVDQSYNGSAEGWVTSTYKNGPDITSYRKGTGVIFDLGSPQNVTKVAFTVGSPGATVEAWTAGSSVTSLPSVANSAPPGFVKQQTKTGAGGSVQITFAKSVNTRYVMIWFTSLPHLDAGQFNGAGFRDSLANVKIYS
ncbi:MAG: hypothetical protein ACRDVE_21810 [Actinocrinis sp.]